jgi:[protein-PII] uridylyltransferase
VLGRYLPEFGGLTCLVQYDVYHKFSADQHSLLAVEHLEALAPGQSAESEGAAQVFNEVDKPELLMLGMLLHDIGKAKGHGHVAKGIPLVRELTARIGLPPEDAGMVEFLVAHHLTMSHIAQRRDIDDPKTIETFAETVAEPQRLRMLYLLTYADMRAVGPGVLTGWQARILHELYARTLARLTGGRSAKPNRAALGHRLFEALRGDVSRQAVKAHLAMVSDDGRAPAADRPPRVRPARHRAGPPPGSRLLRPGRRHARRGGAVLAHRRHAGRPRREHHLGADRHPRGRHRHRHLPGERPHR